MTRFFLCCVAALLTTLCLACNGGPAPVPPTPSTFLVLKSGSNLGISAPEDSADPGTIVNISSGGTGSGTTAADGSVAFNATGAEGPLVVSYIKAGQPLTRELTVAPLSSLVSTPHFATGSAPNDMEVVDGEFFVANSLDNTVVHYGAAGSVLKTWQFDQFAAPAFVTAAGDTLYVVTNGSNELWAAPLTELAHPTISNVALNATGMAFLAPGKPTLVGGRVYIPHSAITGFGPPTTYGDFILEGRDLTAPESDAFELRSTEASNGAFVAHNAARGEIYFTAAGEQQFDENFHPFVTSDSQLLILLDDGTPVTSLNFGPIGVTTIALSPRGDVAYLGNLLSGNIYKVDLAARTILRGADNPIQLTSEFTYVSDLEFVPGTDLLLATSFNTDELYVIDTATDTVSPAPYPGPFQVSPDPELLAGAIGVEADATGNAYVLLSIANAVARVDLLP